MMISSLTMCSKPMMQSKPDVSWSLSISCKTCKQQRRLGFQGGESSFVHALALPVSWLSAFTYKVFMNGRVKMVRGVP